MSSTQRRKEDIGSTPLRGPSKKESKHMQFRFIHKLATAGLAAALVIAALVAAAPAHNLFAAASAQDAPATALPRTITVVGEGVVNIKPDVARANIGVETLRDTVQEATAENNATLEAVLAALREQGVADVDMTTSSYSVFAERYGSDGPLPNDQVRYRVSNNVTVLVRDLDALGTVLDAAVVAGANNIYGVEFLLDDATAARSEARALAVANAQATAAELAELNGLGVGAVVSISEVIGQAGGFYNNQFMQSSLGRGGGEGLPIEPGQLRLTMQLQIVYELVE
jgi:uncharacterized protein YggE